MLNSLSVSHDNASELRFTFSSNRITGHGWSSKLHELRNFGRAIRIEDIPFYVSESMESRVRFPNYGIIYVKQRILMFNVLLNQTCH